MSNFCRIIAALASVGVVMLGSSCSQPVPAEPSQSDGSATLSASAIGDIDTPLSTLSPQGAHLLGRVLSEEGEPVDGCLIQIEGDTNEYAIVSGSEGRFKGWLRWGPQALIIDCHSELYTETRVAIEVPEIGEFTQDFTVKSR